MQQVSLLIIVFSTTAFATYQGWNFYPHGENPVGSGNKASLYGNVMSNYMTKKRAINGQLRRSSILWGKRAQGWKEFDNDDEMPIWTQDQTVQNQGNIDRKNEEHASFKSLEQDPVVSDKHLLERVTKDGIRPKLALSSRLWGRR